MVIPKQVEMIEFIYKHWCNVELNKGYTRKETNIHKEHKLEQYLITDSHMLTFNKGFSAIHQELYFLWLACLLWDLLRKGVYREKNKK